MHDQTKPITLKFNLYDYSLVAAIMLCCYAYMGCCCNLVLFGKYICFVVNCKSSYAISTMLVCVACAKVITPCSNNFLSCPFPKVLVYRYLYECYLCFVLLCIFMAMVQCYLVDICMSVCLFCVVAYTSWLCGKMLLWLELGKVCNRARCGGRVVCIARKTL